MPNAIETEAGAPHAKSSAPSAHRFLHFRLQGKLGEGGMGAVYKAFDEKLRRTVAVKVPGAAHLDDPRLKHSFFREARSAAAVSHPCVAAVFEVHEEHAPPFLVMEYVDGESLRVRLEQGRMPVMEVVRIATMIAEALASAHTAGIVHRDLKPENVMMRAAGGVKLLDFGIAKLVASEGDVAHQATQPLLRTLEGKIIGTPEYMSPEQATGAEVDARSDVFSFGVLLYEMLSGTSPFRRARMMETAIAVSRDEPRRIARVRSDVSPALESLVTRCLSKRAADRFANGAELERALRDSRAVAGRSRTRLAIGAAAVALLGAGGFAVARAVGSRAAPLVFVATESSMPMPSARPLRYGARLLTEEKGTFVVTSALSPDGKRLAFVDAEGRVWLRPVDGEGAREVSRAASPPILGFLADGRRLFVSWRNRGGDPSTIVSIVPLDGSEEERLEIPHALDAVLSPDGELVAYSDRDGVFLRPRRGGDVTRLTSLASSDTLVTLAFSPNFARVALGIKSDPNRIEILEIGGNARSTIQAEGLLSTDGAIVFGWSDSDHLVYAVQPSAASADSVLYEIPAGGGERRSVYAWRGGRISELTTGGGRILAALQTPRVSVQRARFRENGAALEDARSASDMLPAAGQIHPSAYGWLDESTLFVALHTDTSTSVFAGAPGGPLQPFVEVPTVSLDFRTWWPARTSDGALLVWSRTDRTAPCRLLAARRSGDTREVMAARPSFPCGSIVRCPRVAARCIVATELAGEKRFSWLDVGSGRVGELIHRGPLAHTKTIAGWDLSPDGSRIALVESASSVTLIATASGDARELKILGQGNLEWLSFAPDGKSLVFSAFSIAEGTFALLHADLQGHVTVLRARNDTWMSRPVLSPNGTDLLFYARQFRSELRLLEPLP